jgi:hypothetical protein
MELAPTQNGTALALTTAIAFGAFASEDGATIMAATLAASGALDVAIEIDVEADSNSPAQ